MKEIKILSATIKFCLFLVALFFFFSSPKDTFAIPLCGESDSKISITTTANNNILELKVKDNNPNSGNITTAITIKCDGQPIINQNGQPTPFTVRVEKNKIKGSCTLFADTFSDKTYKCSYPIQTVHTLGSPQIKTDTITLPIRIDSPFQNPNTDLTGYFLSFECKAYSIPHTWFFADFSNYQNGVATFTIRGYSDMKPSEFPQKVDINSCHNFTLFSPNRKKVSSLQDLHSLANTPCRFLDPNAPEYQNCINCMGNAKSPTGKVWTVFGCVDTTSTGGLFSTVFKFLSYMLGGVAMLLLIYASFLYITSQGDAEKIKTAKSLLTAIFAGMLFIIFSIMIMKFVGITLLDLPTINK